MRGDAILDAIRALSADERAELAAKLGREVQPLVLLELERRVANAKANPGVGYTWDEVVAHVKRAR